MRSGLFYLWSVIIFALGFPRVLAAADEPPSLPTFKPEDEAIDIGVYPNRDSESWYTLWGLGSGTISYPGEMGDFFKTAKQNGVSSTIFVMDFLGFYAAMNPKLMVGGIIHANAEALQQGDDALQANMYVYGLSAQYSFGNNTGDGLFARGDVGAARILISATDGKKVEQAISPWGVGIYAGIGYAQPLGRGTSILFNLGYTGRQVDGDLFQTMDIFASFLF